MRFEHLAFALKMRGVDKPTRHAKARALLDFLAQTTSKDTGAYGTLFWIDPVEQLAVVFMAHTPGPARLHYRRLLPTLVNQAIMQ